MATNDKAWMRKIKDLTECSICAEEFIDPRALPCLHTFCLKCLRALVRKTDSDESYLCPLCRCEFDIPGRGVNDFPKNFYVDSLIEVDKEGDSPQSIPYNSACCDVCSELKTRAPQATWFCIECDQNLCDHCFQCHKRITSTSKHRLVPSSIASRGSSAGIKTPQRKFCERHPERVTELWCLGCREAACTMCLLSDHNGHRCTSIRDSSSRQTQTGAAQLGARPRVLAAAPAQQSGTNSAASRSAASLNNSNRVVTMPTEAAAVETETPASEFIRLISQRLAEVISTQSVVTTTAVVTSSLVTPTIAATSTVNSSTRTSSASTTTLTNLTVQSLIRSTLALIPSSSAATSTVNSSTNTSRALVAAPIASATTRPSTVVTTQLLAAATTQPSSAASSQSPITVTSQTSINSESTSSSATGASASAAESAPPFTFTGHCYRCGWQGHRAFECQEQEDVTSSFSPPEAQSGIASAEARSPWRESSSEDETSDFPGLSILARTLASLRNQAASLHSRQAEILGDSDSSSEASGAAAAPAPSSPPKVITCNGCGGVGHYSRWCRNKQQCRNCGCYGHKAETCWKEAREPKCYECNEMGHVAQDCPTTASRRERT